MSDRVRAGLGMERPELAVLLAYAKRSLTDALLESGLPDDPALEADLRGYFPAAVVERLGHLLGEHPLRRELIATIAANNAVDALGPTFVSRLVTEQGAEPAAVVRAYRIAREVTGADARWDAIERLERSVDRAVQWGLMDDVDWLVEATTRWYLASAPGADLAAAIATGRAGFERLAAALPTIDSDERRDQREHLAAELLARGVPERMAHGHAALAALVHAPDAIAVAQTTGRPVEDVARAFMRLGAELRLAWLEDEIEALPAATRMQRWAAQAVRDDVLDARRRLAQRALLDAPDAEAEDAVATFLAARAGACARMSAFARALNVEGAADLAGLTLAVRQLRALVE
jgi:glutamate dehydrogenase